MISSSSSSSKCIIMAICYGYHSSYYALEIKQLDYV